MIRCKACLNQMGNISSKRKYYSHFHDELFHFFRSFQQSLNWMSHEPKWRWLWLEMEEIERKIFFLDALLILLMMMFERKHAFSIRVRTSSDF